jgi:hypothetical protein
MTTVGPQRKPPLFRPGMALILAASVSVSVSVSVLAWLPATGPAGAATTERVVVDRHSGLAINGFDPVAYFTDSRALPGKDEFESPFAGAVWRFRSEGNQAAFAADPDVYMPRFGGYDPVGVARGVPVPGNPRFWLIEGDRLYLFNSSEAAEEFARDSARAIAIADRKWPSIQRKLAQ